MSTDRIAEAVERLRVQAVYAAVEVNHVDVLAHFNGGRDAQFERMRPLLADALRALEVKA